jgi:hypothetical protein
MAKCQTPIVATVLAILLSLVNGEGIAVPVPCYCNVTVTTCLGLSTCSTRSSDVNYYFVGCFKEPRLNVALNDRPWELRFQDTSQMAVHRCIINAKYRGHLYAGLQAGCQCFSGQLTKRLG